MKGLVNETWKNGITWVDKCGIATPRRLQSCPKTLQTSFLVLDKLRSPYLFLQVQFLSFLIDCNSKQRISEMCLSKKLLQGKFYSTIMKSSHIIFHGKNGELTDLTLPVPWLGGWGQSAFIRRRSHAQAKTLGHCGLCYEASQVPSPLPLPS